MARVVELSTALYFYYYTTMARKTTKKLTTNEDVMRAIEPMSAMDAMSRLAQVMNDSPTVVKMANTEWPIKALRPATQWLIAEESLKIQKSEEGNFSDVIKQFAQNIPSVVKVLTLAILNDKKRIYGNNTDGTFSEEYRAVYDTIMWETDSQSWIGLLVEVMNMLSLDYFFASTNAIAMIREMALGKKMTMEEQKQSLAVPNTVK